MTEWHVLAGWWLYSRYLICIYGGWYGCMVDIIGILFIIGVGAMLWAVYWACCIFLDLN